jgi:hypothetical protein
MYVFIHMYIYKISSMNDLDSFLLFQFEVVMLLFFIGALAKTVPS